MSKTQAKCTEQCGHQEKAQWPDGPWKNEPDRVEFRHAGLPCLLHRNRVGAWCGYAAVPPGHPLYGLDYDVATDKANIDVHGGLTFANECTGPICHEPEPGEPDQVWWFGFDCVHLWDTAPGMLTFERKNGFERDDRDVYRDLAYARAETEKLAEQLARCRSVLS